VRQMTGMAKMRKYPKQEATPPKISEEPSTYMPSKKLPISVADFTYRKFKKIADLVPFTQAEWANILHLSERTLQRYAKNNSSFEGIYTDRILDMQALIETGLETFSSADTLYSWLKKDKQVLGHVLNFESLYNSRGILELTDQLGRIQYGVYT